ncbi:protein tincar [Teleopsis dalmanni]|uniref:protein tincar n=1 Tax=Teleopsis dalmanni TaxID=139649 RepID=UPI0018CCF8C5|nr:protein tincar [Teleopsis dalmanni]
MPIKTTSNSFNHQHPEQESCSHYHLQHMNSRRKRGKQSNKNFFEMDHNTFLHLNSLWSIWYGVLFTLFQGYLAVHGAYRFLGCSLIQWKIEPVTELNLQIILSGVVFILLPFFFTSAVFKVGNLANDGVKLATGSKGRRCSMATHDGLEEEPNGGTIRTLWTHGGPTAAFVHLLIAMCLLMPRLLLEARIIENGLLPKENIWQSELDFLIINRRNLVVNPIHISQRRRFLFENEYYFKNTSNINEFVNGLNKGVNKNIISSNKIKAIPPNNNLISHDLTDLIYGKSNDYDESINIMRNDETNHKIKPQLTESLFNKDNIISNEFLPNNITQTTSEIIITTNLENISAKPMRLNYLSNNSNENVEAALITTNKPLFPMTAQTTASFVKLHINPTKSIIIKKHYSNTTTQTPTTTSANEGSTHKKKNFLYHNYQHKNNNSKTHKNTYRHQRQNVLIGHRPINTGELNSRETKKTAIRYQNKTELYSGNESFEFANNNLHTSDRHMSYDNAGLKLSTDIPDPDIISTVRSEILSVSSTSAKAHSKIIEKRPKKPKVKRMADSVLDIEIEPAFLISNFSKNYSNENYAMFVATSTNNESFTDTLIKNISIDGQSDFIQLNGFAGMLQILFGIEKPIDVDVFNHPPSFEFLNLLLALTVWSVRYPAVFWATTKKLAIIFSIQIVFASIDIIFSYAGVSNLYKMQVYSEATPIKKSGLLLNAVVTLALFLLSSALIIASSMILYLYGHGRLTAKVRSRSMITIKSNKAWIYFAHCASLCYILAIAVVKAPLLNDLNATYRKNFHHLTFFSVLISVVNFFMWIVIWLSLSAKRHWTFKLPPIDSYDVPKISGQPLLMSSQSSLPNANAEITTQQKGVTKIDTSANNGSNKNTNINGNNDIYWPKIISNSPKLRVTFNEVTSTSEDALLISDQKQTDGKRDSSNGTMVCFTSVTGEIDEGEYATLSASFGVDSAGLESFNTNIQDLNHKNGENQNSSTPNELEYNKLQSPQPQLMKETVNSYAINVTEFMATGTELTTNTVAEKSKLLAYESNEGITLAKNSKAKRLSPTSSNSVNYANSTVCQPFIKVPQHLSTPERLFGPLAPVTVAVHTNEAHITSSSIQRCIRRADSGVPNEALTPRSDSTSTTESTTSPPERAPSESSSGVHSSEERDVEVIIRPRSICKSTPKPQQPIIEEEPYGRCTNMRMSSFIAKPLSVSANTLPHSRTSSEPKYDYIHHCSTMPLPVHNAEYTSSNISAYSNSLSAHSMNSQQQPTSSFKSQLYANTTSAISDPQQQQQPLTALHTTLPNGVRYSNPHFLRRMSHVGKLVESSYEEVEIGAGHHTFSKLLHEPLKNGLTNSVIPENCVPINYTVISNQ